MPGVDVQGASAIVAGFVVLLLLSIVKFVIDRQRNGGNQPLGGGVMKHKADVKLFGYSTLATLWSIGTGRFAGALSS